MNKYLSVEEAGLPTVIKKTVSTSMVLFNISRDTYMPPKLRCGEWLFHVDVIAQFKELYLKG